MRAGDYRTRLTWLRTTLGTPDGFGQKPEETTALGSLWCAVEDVVANRESRKESERQITTATIRVRNYPDVRPGDQLRDDGESTTWTVLTAVAGDNETLCEVEV